jgi:hypothetical protein
MRDPILASTQYVHKGTRYRLTVTGGLQYLRGNSAPYFSITVDQDRQEHGRWAEDCGGCCHDLIEARFPEQFSDLIALHLSDIDGAPMHAEANGWYHLAAACGGLGEKYHAGNSKRQMWKGDQDAVGEREFDGYREPTPDECLQTFADHCRISYSMAVALRDDCLRESRRDTPQGIYHVPAVAREVWREACAGMRARWKAEADACVARLNLRVYGDPWTRPEVAS